MSNERFLVTGAMGCIGAWVIRNLLYDGVTTAAFDLGTDRQRLELILQQDEINQIEFITGDISDLHGIFSTFEKFQPTHVIHLAALQLPFCRANPPLGALVNVVGTVNIFEAVKKYHIDSLVYASTAAVYGTSEEYETSIISDDTLLKPRSHYGVYKQANEGTARVYWLDDRVPTIGLRPYTVFGPGRDQGMTSTPTKAMLAAVVGLPYKISFGGRCVFQYANDVGKVFILAARNVRSGADVFNIGGPSVSVPDVIQAIEDYIPSMRGKITFEDNPLPFPPDMDNSNLVRLLGPLPFTPLQQAVAETIETLRAAIQNKMLSHERVEQILR